MKSLLLECKKRLKKHKNFTPILPIGVATIGVFLSSSAIAADLTTGETSVVEWNKVALQAIKDTSPGPTVAARALSILHTGIFDAWSAYDPVAIGTQLGDTLQRPLSENTLANKNKAIGYAAYRTLVDLFPSELTAFNSVMSNLGYDPSDISTDTATAAGIGNVAAKALLDFRHHDGSNQLGDLHPGAYSDYTNYKSVNLPDKIFDPDPSTIKDPNRWQPLILPDGSVQQYLTPFWGQVTPFGLASGDRLRPTKGPKTTADPEYLEQAKQLLDISANLTNEQKAIAEYWSGGAGTVTPPGYWNEFAQVISQRDNHDLDRDVKMFFALDNALLDASIAVWDVKRFYDAERPATAIHYLFNGQTVRAWGGPGQGTQSIDGKNWLPYLIVTNPFPEYVSGHSTFSPAAAEILKRFTGSDDFGYSVTLPKGSSFIEPGGFATDITLNWPTFTDAAEQAGLSRLYGGIHWEDAEVEGQKLGREVAALSWLKAESYISPKSVPEPSSVFGTLMLGALGALSLLKSRLKKHKLGQ